ncbi:Uncharacterised protein [Legionella busanensis]|uniref:Transmembrane protein n=1 Tax=Legionella busanensis TaxID=190655 RepID=A0A378K9R5_9GAMM|nr:hypothetical protein [Legionella busanensis]STX81269.1 Uncharacterised protein [Legionella busanensis]
MTNTKAFQASLREDIENLPNLQLDSVSPSSFYFPLLKEWFRYFIILCLANVVVVYGLAYTSSFYIRGVHHLARDIILPNFFFSLALLVFLSQYHIFRLLAKDKLKSLNYIQEVINKLELVFLALFILFYAFCLQTEGDIAGTIMGASVSAFVSASLCMGLVVMFGAARVGLPVILSLISKFLEKKQDNQAE